jgi:hypothetical protein
MVDFIGLMGYTKETARQTGIFLPGQYYEGFHNDLLGR